MRPIGTLRLIKIAALLLMLRALSSCIEVDNHLGSSLLPDNQLFRIEQTSLPLPIKNRVSDSLQTYNSPYLTIGHLRDANLGEVKASSVFNLTPSVKGQYFGEAPTLRSLKISLTINSTTTLNEEDQFLPQNFRIYKLLSKLDSTTRYSSSLSDITIDSEPLQRGGNLFFGGDSLIIELAPSFGEELLSISQESMDSLELFQDEIRGLYIEADGKPEGEVGGRISLITMDNVYLTLTYHHKESEKEIDKDSTIYYYISSGLPRANLYQHHSSTLESDNPTEEIFLEGLSGLKPYIDFEDIKDQLISWATANSINIDKLVIAKADLKLPFEYPLDYREISHFPSQVALMVRRDAELPIYQAVEDYSGDNNNGSINRSLKEYSLDVSAFLQSVLSGRLTGRDSEAYILPIYQTSDQYSGAVYTHLQNFQYSKAILNGIDKERAPSLVLTYSVIP